MHINSIGAARYLLEVLFAGFARVANDHHIDGDVLQIRPFLLFCDEGFRIGNLVADVVEHVLLLLVDGSEELVPTVHDRGAFECLLLPIDAFHTPEEFLLD